MCHNTMKLMYPRTDSSRFGTTLRIKMLMPSLATPCYRWVTMYKICHQQQNVPQHYYLLDTLVFKSWVLFCIDFSWYCPYIYTYLNSSTLVCLTETVFFFTIIPCKLHVCFSCLSVVVLSTFVYVIISSSCYQDRLSVTYRISNMCMYVYWCVELVFNCVLHCFQTTPLRWCYTQQAFKWEQIYVL